MANLHIGHAILVADTKTTILLFQSSLCNSFEDHALVDLVTAPCTGKSALSGGFSTQMVSNIVLPLMEAHPHDLHI